VNIRRLPLARQASATLNRGISVGRIVVLLKSEREFHRKTAVRCFNETWDYLEKKERTELDDQEMLRLAHASRYHWGIVGTPRNKAVGDWQISHVYAALKQPHLSLLFAKSSLKTCKREKLSEVLATAYEAVARAYAVAENHASASKYLKLARDQLETLDLRAEDRNVYLGQIEETKKLIE
jgi:hypothetical protein